MRSERRVKPVSEREQQCRRRPRWAPRPERLVVFVSHLSCDRPCRSLGHDGSAALCQRSQRVHSGGGRGRGALSGPHAAASAGVEGGGGRNRAHRLGAGSVRSRSLRAARRASPDSRGLRGLRARRADRAQAQVGARRRGP